MYKVIPRMPWLISALPIGLLAFYLTSQLLLYTGAQKATWLRIETNSIDISTVTQPPPPIHVSYNNGSSQYPVIWDNQGDFTFIGIAPFGSDHAPQLLQIHGDGRPISFEVLKTGLPKRFEISANPSLLNLKGSGLLRLPGNYHNLTLSFYAGPGAGKVEIMWLDQDFVVDLAEYLPGAHDVRLDLPTANRGWVLLPPLAIQQITFHMNGSGTAHYSLRNVILHAQPVQIWTPSDLSGPYAPDFYLPHLRAINVVPLFKRLAIWLSLCGIGFAILALLSYAGASLRRLESSYEVVESRLGVWIRRVTRGWTAGKVMLTVCFVSLSFHLSYAMFVPLFYSNDSEGYYQYARDFLSTHSLDAFFIYRTPGYPMFIAMAVWVGGHHILSLVLLQHLALTMLGVAAVWFLYDLTNPLFSAIGGLLVGLSPLNSIMANIVWTESLFAVVTCISLFVLLRYQEKPIAMLTAGLLVGLATMIRPNGVILLFIMLATLFTSWWCKASGTRILRQLALCGIMLLSGYFFVTAPWYLHFHSRTGDWGLAAFKPFFPGYELTEYMGKQEAERTGTLSLPSLAAYLNGRHQGPLRDASLLVNRPYKAVITLADDGFGILRLLPRLFDDDRFATEAFRESLRRNPRQYLENVRSALLFNLFHLSPHNTVFIPFRDAESLVKMTRQYRYPLGFPKDLTSPAADTGDLLKQMISRWEPPESRARSFLIGTTQFAMDFWGLSVAIALAASFICVPFPALVKTSLCLSIYSLSVMAAPALIGMGVDRYAMVTEPMIYLLVILLLFALSSMRLRRRIRLR